MHDDDDDDDDDDDGDGDDIDDEDDNHDDNAYADANADTMLLLMRGDAYSGVIDRTFVISATEGANIVYYAFNARVSQFTIDASPSAEAKCNFTIHPRGNLYGWSNNA